MEIKIEGKMIIPDDISHKKFIYIFMKVLSSHSMGFQGTTTVIDDTKLYEKDENR